VALGWLCAIIKQLTALKVIFPACNRRYSVLPPGLLQMHALTRLHFITADPPRTLPPLDPLLQMPNLQQVCCYQSGAQCWKTGMHAMLPMGHSTESVRVITIWAA
jgi:hypothetical protein